MAACYLSSGGVRIPGLIKYLKTYIMCWISDSAELLTAKSEMVVFKVCMQHQKTKALISYYYNSVYILGTQKEEGIELDKIYDNFVIRRGLHCYNTNKFIPKVDELVLGISPYHHFYDSGAWKAVVVRGYIPVGASYYINKNQEIVTNKLVLTDVLDLV